MFLIPMMGKSSRFISAGYAIPKFMLPIGNSNLFSKAVASFKEYFADELFVFTIPNDDSLSAWIINQVNTLGVANHHIIKLNNSTNGQADTIAQSINKISSSNLSDINIFNIDTILHSFNKLRHDSYDGYLEVFNGEGEHWSFAKINHVDEVISTAEKERISSHCSNGFYNFKNSEIFMEGFNKQLEHNKLTNAGELYIAPIYNFLISLGYKFIVKHIEKEDISFSGTPTEYEELIKK